MKEFKSTMRAIMIQMWRLVKVYGMSKSEALKKAWMLFKLRKAMHERIVKFYYEKLSGEIRTAWGTLRSDLIPQTVGSDNRKKNDSVMVYYDEEKAAYRCFKIANLIKIA